MEEWKVYSRCRKDIFEVSNTGMVRKNGIIWQPKPTVKGYIKVRRNKEQVFLHRMIAELWEIPNTDPQNKTQIRHLDDNKLNNSVENLAWGDGIDNAKDRKTNGRYKHTDASRKRMATSKLGNKNAKK